MADEVNTELLATMVRRRVALCPNLREAAKVAGVSPATLSRVQRGHAPDTDALVALARWLQIPVEEVLYNPPDIGVLQKGSTPEKVTLHLRADPVLSTESAEHLAAIFTAVYNDWVDRERQKRERP
jgi:transcriptional regulator with XRE-family HTH domain